MSTTPWEFEIYIPCSSAPQASTSGCVRGAGDQMLGAIWGLVIPQGTLAWDTIAPGLVNLAAGTAVQQPIQISGCGSLVFINWMCFEI